MIKIKTDSRKIEKGDTFIAIKGLYKDGHDYIEDAIENGATTIVAQHGNYDVETIIVKDTREYLIEYLYNKYKKILNRITFIGITGTNGKTTTSYFIHQILNELNIPCAYIGTIGFFLDKKEKELPNTSQDILTLYNLILYTYEKGYRYIILEASSEALVEKRFDKIPFEIALLTNITRDHLDYHNTKENYINAKKILFENLINKKIAIINNDEENKSNFLLKENKNITYGIKNGDYKIIKYNIKNNAKFTYSYNNKKYKIQTNITGLHNIYNLLGSIALINSLGIDLKEINKKVKKLSLPDGRMEIIKYKSNKIIIDYAHTPDAIDKIISLSKKITKNNIYVVFGCTGNRDKEKRPIMTNIVLSNVKKAIITNDDLHNEDEKEILNDMLKENDKSNYEVCFDRKKAIEKGIDLLNRKDTLLILGKGHEKYMIIKDKKMPFNDKKTVLEYIKR